MTRVLDFTFSLFGLLILSPIFLIIAFLIVFDSGFPVLFKQIRIGLNGEEFKLLKFRTMKPNSDKKGLLTVGKDNRVTRIGRFLRKSKMDELPQLINVLRGEMSFVGPRPEVEKYVKLYNEEQRSVLSVKPGITDLASIEYMDENEVLDRSSDPEKTYIEEIMPHKIEINLKYIESKSLGNDFKVILRTIGGLIR